MTAVAALGAVARAGASRPAARQRAASSGSGSGSAGLQRRRRTRSSTPPTKKGGTLRIGQLRRLGLAGPGATRTTPTRGTSSATTAGRWRCSSRRRARRAPSSCPTWPDPGQAQRRRQDLDLHAAHGREVRGRHPGHVARTSSTPSSGRWTRTTFPNGPTYFNDFLDLQGYTSPTRTQTRTSSASGDRDAGRPDDRLPPEASRSRASTTSRSSPPTAPVPQAKDTGTKYKEHVVSTGPYMFETNQLGKSFVLVRNTHWDPAPTRTASRCRTVSRSA